jgi:hypothetical protein
MSYLYCIVRYRTGPSLISYINLGPTMPFCSETNAALCSGCETLPPISTSNSPSKSRQQPHPPHPPPPPYPPQRLTTVSAICRWPRSRKTCASSSSACCPTVRRHCAKLSSRPASRTQRTSWRRGSATWWAGAFSRRQAGREIVVHTVPLKQKISNFCKRF